MWTSTSEIGCENPQIELEKLIFLNGDGRIIRFVVEKCDRNNNPLHKTLRIGLKV
jgi:hypothetical protein